METRPAIREYLAQARCVGLAGEEGARHRDEDRGPELRGAAEVHGSIGAALVPAL